MLKKYHSFDLTHIGVQELYYSFQNTTDSLVIINQYELATLTLPTTFERIIFFESGWGKEITKREVDLVDILTFKNEKGRSSGEYATFFSIYDTTSNKKIDFAISISSNFEVCITRKEDGIRIQVNYPDHNFKTNLSAHSELTFPKVLAHVYETTEECFKYKHQYNQEFLKPNYSSQLQVVYNHWWAYEDRHINEAIILENAKIAKEIGCEILVLDAGWFGNDSDDEEWFSVRGDWQSTNKVRFPRGIETLADEIRSLGLNFGIWCEIEGLGVNAKLAQEKPQFVANRDGSPLGYVCLGQKEAQDWAIEILSDLVSKTKSTYMKLDFNLDPEYGCNDVTHDHDEYDGLWSHYEGLYWVLDELKSRFPEVVIENCSSGGQRFDLEMMKHSDVMFLSDPDYSVHQLRIFTEVSKWLLPSQLLHFMWSNTVTTNGSSPFGNLNLDLLSVSEVRYHMRLAMMHHFGISHRLIDYKSSTLEQIKHEIKVYKEEIRPFVQNGQFMILNDSPDSFVAQYELDNECLVIMLSTKQQYINLAEFLSLPIKTLELIDLDSKERLELTLCFNFESGLHSRSIIIKK